VFVAEERNPAELAAFIDSNREALRLIRAALKEESQVPVVYNKSYDDHLLKNVVKVTLVGNLLSKEGKLAELQGDRGYALDCYLGQLKLARHISRGGLIVDHLTGAAIESMGLDSIAEMAPELSPRERQRAIQAIEAIDREREPVETVIARDRDWSRRAYSIADKFKMMWEEKTLFPMRSTVEKSGNRLSRLKSEVNRVIRILQGKEERSDAGKPEK
jgi:hypothetical protein